MTTKNYFKVELTVIFTMSELSTIASALFTDWEDNCKNNRMASAQEDREIHEKLLKQMKKYEEILK